MVEEAARRLAKSHGVPRENVAVTFSHSHCTPKVNGACDNIFSQTIPPDHRKHIDRYTKELADGLLGRLARRLLSANRLDWNGASARPDSRRSSVAGWGRWIMICRARCARRRG